MDFIGPLPEQKGCRYIDVLIDRFSRYVVLVPTADDRAQTAVESFWSAWVYVTLGRRNSLQLMEDRRMIVGSSSK